MAVKKNIQSRSRYAILGVLTFGPATGYEIRKLLGETTAHFWKESYGQIYPVLDELSREGLVEVVSHNTDGRETKQFRILSGGRQVLRQWIRSPEINLKPGRHELLLKLFFTRRDDIPWILPQIESYAATVRALLVTYTAFGNEDDDEDQPEDARVLIGTTIDYGIAAAQMQIEWCERTAETLKSLAESS